MKSRVKTLESYLSESFFSNLGVGEYQRIKTWLDEMKIKNCTINKDLAVDVYSNVDLGDKHFSELPVKFGIIDGWFNLTNNIDLNTLKGCPEIVKNGFYCSNCPKLKSLKYAPKSTLSFYCHNCGGKFTDADVRKVSNVKHHIIS